MVFLHQRITIALKCTVNERICVNVVLPVDLKPEFCSGPGYVFSRSFHGKERGTFMTLKTLTLSSTYLMTH